MSDATTKAAPASFVPAAAQHMVATIEPRDVSLPPSPDNCWVKRMYVTAWSISADSISTPLLLETPAANAWWGHLGPDGSVLQPGGKWFESVQAMQEAYLAKWQELVDAGQAADSRMSS